MTTELQTLALEIAHDEAASEIKWVCRRVYGEDDVWFDLDRFVAGGDSEKVARAERFLDLAGRLERRADNPRIVRIKAGERDHG